MNGQAYQVTAFYDSKADAEAGADILRNNGIASGDIDIIAGREAEQVHEHGSDGGFMDKLSSFFMPEEDRHAYAEGLGRGGYVLRVDVAEKDHQRVVDLLDTDNSVDLDERANAWRAEGWDGGSAGAATDTDTGTGTSATAPRTGATDDGTIEVAEEQLKIGKRDTSHGRVRVRSYTVEEPVSAEVTLESERADIERHKVDRVVDDADAVFQDKTITVDERSEEAVVSKETHVVEEIDVHKDIERETKTVEDTVRRTEVEIDRD